MARERTFDVLIVGAGPAGMAAMVSVCAKGPLGWTIGVVDDNPSAGGQIWRGEAKDLASVDHLSDYEARVRFRQWHDRALIGAFEFLSGTQILGPLEPGVLLAEAAGEAIELRYRKLILATGARELLLPFPGWTLPNVMGAGGLQAMVKSGMPITGKRVVVAGSGPLLLAVAAYLKRRNADIRLIAEQATTARLVRFAAGLWREPWKLKQAVDLRRSMGRIPLKTGCWPVAAEGDGALEAVSLTDGRKTWREPCDYLACGFGLVPNVELAATIGCTLRGGTVGVDAFQRTNVGNVFAAGELTGIGGVDSSLVEGEIAGFAAVGAETRHLSQRGDAYDDARSLFPRRDRARRFARRLERAFALRDELRQLPRPETIVCRCEDVADGSLMTYSSWTEAKLQARCGMGPCQGRVCGAAAEFLYGWTRTSIRPPIFPTELGHLAGRRGGD